MFWAKPASPRKRLLSASLLTALAVAVTGCGGSDEADEASATPSASPTSASPSEEASPSPTPTESPTASLSEEPAGSDESPVASPTSQPSTTVEATEEPETAPVQPPPPGSSPREMLLGRSELPGLNEQHSWRLVRTENAERRRPVWTCQVTDFISIGATDVWVRRFVGQPGGGESARARSAVITFVDALSARRAYAVLRAWHDRCEEQLNREYGRVRVDAAPTAVDVRRGEAEWRLAVYGPVPGDREASYFDATGYVREGTRISLTTIVSAGQDYNYPPGEEPIVGAVLNSATKLLG